MHGSLLPSLMTVVILLGGTLHLAFGDPAPRPPNLLYIICDEVRADTLGCYGNKRIVTPNLDRLASRGFLFERAYDTQPLCTPNRAALLTGLYPHASGCLDNNIRLSGNLPCLPEMLKGKYATGYFGKWHLGDEVFAQHGFAQWRSTEDMYASYFSEGRDKTTRASYDDWLVTEGKAPKNGKTISRGEAARLPEKFGKPAYLASEATKFIRENKDRPFVLFVSMLEPHMPFYGPRDGQYDPANVTLPGNFNNPPTDDQPLKTRVLMNNFFESGESKCDLKTEAGWRKLISQYWGLCSLVDTHIGEILQTLSDCGLDDDTIIVFTSDHGEMMASHRLVAKSVQFEEALRVPLIVRVPGRNMAVRVAAPVSQIDLLPTLLDLMGQDRPERLQGKSLRPLMEGHSADAGDVFVEWNTGKKAAKKLPVPSALVGKVTPEEAAAAARDVVRTIITPDGWKLNVSASRDEHELYNLIADPLETRNLARDPQYKRKMAELLGRIRKWQERSGDMVKLPEL